MHNVPKYLYAYKLGTKCLICQHCQEHLHDLRSCAQPFPAWLCVLEAEEISDFKIYAASWCLP